MFGEGSEALPSLALPGYHRSVRSPRALLLVASALAACKTVSPPAAVAVSSPCLVTDTSRATPDTIYVLGGALRPPAVDCERRPIDASEVPVVVAVTPPSTVDLRDVLEGRTTSIRRPDVVVTADPRLIDLARRDRAFLVEPLPWSVTYVLVVPALDSLFGPDAAERDAFARNVVTGDARGAVEPFPWQAAECNLATGDGRPSPLAIVSYSSGDVMARSLAERIVSLTGSASRPPWLAPVVRRQRGPLRIDASRDQASQVATGTVAAAVVGVPRDPSTPCGTRDNGRVPRGSIPLIDARQHAIVRVGSGASFIVGVDGSLHFVKRGGR